LASHDIPIGATQVSLAALNERSREIFRQIVESYLATGEPVGSRNLSRLLPITLSPASVRNVMSDLEQLGLIFAPHTSAGRLPTEIGLRFFVDALMQVGDLSEQDRRSIEAQVAGAHTAKSMEAVLTEASQMLSGLTRSAGVVLTAKANVRLKHIEFVRLEPERALRSCCGGRAGRKSCAQCSAGITHVFAYRSGELSQCTHPRQDTGRPSG
jgi:heat-inducible transcriptional repressor